MNVKEKPIEGIEVFSDTSIRIYQYRKDFDCPEIFAIALKKIHTQAINSISEHFTPEQITAWQAGTYKAFIDFARDCHRTYLIFDDEELIIGYAFVLNAGFLWHLYIDPKDQYKGYGTALLNCVENDHRNMKQPSLSLKANEASYRFYLKHGYKVIGNETIDMIGVKLPVKLMKKRI